MRPVTQYEASDGSIWHTESDALFRDTLCEKVKKAMTPLGDRPELPHCGFENGDGYYQHAQSEVRRAKENLLALVKEYGWEWEGLKNAKCPQIDVGADWFARILDGCQQVPLTRAYGRLMCIDNQGREWGQPYFTSHPDEAKQVCLGTSYNFTKESEGVK